GLPCRRRRDRPGPRRGPPARRRRPAPISARAMPPFPAIGTNSEQDCGRLRARPKRGAERAPLSHFGTEPVGRRDKTGAYRIKSVRTAWLWEILTQEFSDIFSN